MQVSLCIYNLHVRPQFKEENRVEEGGEGAPAGAEVVALEVDDCDGDEEEAGDVDDLQQEAEALPDPLLKLTVLLPRIDAQHRLRECPHVTVPVTAVCNHDSTSFPGKSFAAVLQ